jgi:hypothetical protein
MLLRTSSVRKDLPTHNHTQLLLKTVTLQDHSRISSRTIIGSSHSNHSSHISNNNHNTHNNNISHSNHSNHSNHRTHNLRIITGDNQPAIIRINHLTTTRTNHPTITGDNHLLITTGINLNHLNHINHPITTGINLNLPITTGINLNLPITTEEARTIGVAHPTMIGETPNFYHNKITASNDKSTNYTSGMIEIAPDL